MHNSVLGDTDTFGKTGIEQLVRDTRITQIYEGTNGVQAWDLVRRKVLLNRGEYVAEFAELHAFKKC